MLKGCRYIEHFKSLELIKFHKRIKIVYENNTRLQTISDEIENN